MDLDFNYFMHSFQMKIYSVFPRQTRGQFYKKQKPQVLYIEVYKETVAVKEYSMEGRKKWNLSKV